MVYEDENYVNHTPLHTPNLSSCENFKKEVFCCDVLCDVCIGGLFLHINFSRHSGNLESTATDTTGHVNTVL